MSGRRDEMHRGISEARWPKTRETMRCASGKVAAPAADETETLKQSFAEWKKFRPVREFPSSEEHGQVCGKFRAREGGGDTAPHTSSHIHPFPLEAASLARKIFGLNKICDLSAKSTDL